MVAKFTLSLFLVLSGLSLFGQLTNTRRLSYFQSIANYHEVNPPTFPAGYPTWYSLNRRPRAVIYLKNKVENGLIKIDDTTYVAEPIKENADEIFWFANDSCDEFLFYIIPDSKVTFHDYKIFMEELMQEAPNGRFILISSNEFYNELNYTNYSLNCWDLGCIYARDVFEIKMNSLGEIMVEGEIIPQFELENRVSHHYSANINGEVDASAARFSLITRSLVLQRTDQYKEALEDKPENPLIIEELRVWEAKENWIERYGPLTEVSRFEVIRIEIIGYEPTMEYYYNLHGDIAMGLLGARNQLSKQSFAYSYEHLFGLHQFDKIQFIDVQIPDHTTNDFTRAIPRTLPTAENMDR